MNCEVTTIDGYKETMFNMLPQLKHLDNADKDGGKGKKKDFLDGYGIDLFSWKR